MLPERISLDAGVTVQMLAEALEECENDPGNDDEPPSGAFSSLSRDHREDDALSVGLFVAELRAVRTEIGELKSVMEKFSAEFYVRNQMDRAWHDTVDNFVNRFFESTKESRLWNVFGYFMFLLLFTVILRVFGITFEELLHAGSVLFPGSVTTPTPGG